ncbi:MAG: DUF4276 family protein [Microscillaceae bacterium]|nr:DUF4276 family protein [Microscillaceae bacterium]
MKDLYIIVEGETELEFVNRLLIPYFIQRGLNTHIQGLMITMKGGGHGFNNIKHFKNTIAPILFYDSQPVITTMIDHYGINSEDKLPNYENCIKEIDVEKRIQCMEKSLETVVKTIVQNYPYFIPNIIRHEMETVLFANPNEGFDLEKEAIKTAVLKVYSQFSSIEDINSTPEGAPSKRLIKIYEDNGEKYKKGADAIDIAELTGMEAILAKCPRLKTWIEKIIKLVIA